MELVAEKTFAGHAPPAMRHTMSEVEAVAGAYDAEVSAYLAGRTTNASFRSQCALLREWLAPCGERLLDIGCGTGDFLSLVRRQFRLPVGMDVSKRMLDAAAAQLAVGGAPPLLRASATALPFASASFEVVSSMGAAEYVADLNVMLRECHRVLRPGGRLLVTCTQGACLSKRLGTWLRETLRAVKRRVKNTSPGSGDPVVYRRLPEIVDELVNAAGFKIEQRAFCGVRVFPWPLTDVFPRTTRRVEDRAEGWSLVPHSRLTCGVYAVHAERV